MPPAPPAQLESQSAIPIKVLIVDDREENLVALEAALAECKYQLFLAQSGAEAVKLVKRHDFAIILLDVQMPSMNGYETAVRIRQDQHGASAPIIFVTAIDRTEEFEQHGYIAGAVDYLFKPLNVDILRAKLRVFAELYRRNVENQNQASLLKEAALKEQENVLLKEAIATRDEFISMAAHELRTPITPLNLQMQLFLKMYQDGSIENVPRERLVRLLKVSQDQIDRLSRLIGELVDVSRIKSGKLELKLEAVELGALTESVLAGFSEEIQRSGCAVTLTAPKPLTGHWDRFRIEQVIVNLLTNSLKYGVGKPVEITIAEENGRAIFRIRDHGIGIDEADHKRIFERFERAVSSKHYGGLGLGLYIACMIVRLHDGDIGVESQLGRGATFTVHLPLGSAVS